MRAAGTCLLAALAIWFFWTGRRARSAVRAQRNLEKHLLGPVSDTGSRTMLFARLSERMDGTRAALTLRGLLEASGLAISWPVLRRCWLASVLLLPTAGFLVTGSLLAIPPALTTAICLPGFALKYLGRARERRRCRQLDDFAADLALFLRSGIPVEDALVLCARDASPVFADAVSRFQADVALGTGTGEALDEMVSRLDNRDLRLIAQAMMTSRETGADIRPIMDTIGETVRERAAIRRELASQTVQGRLSGRIVAALPLIFLCLSAIASRSTIAVLVGTLPGLLMLLTAAAMNVAGFLWIKKILKIDDRG